MVLASFLTWLFSVVAVVTWLPVVTPAAHPNNIAIPYGDPLMLTWISDHPEFTVSWEYLSGGSRETKICGTTFVLDELRYASTSIPPKEGYSCFNQDGQRHILNVASNYVAAGAYLSCIGDNDVIAVLVNLFHAPLVEFTEAAAEFKFSYSGFMDPVNHLECRNVSHSCSCNRSQSTEMITYNVTCICPMTLELNLDCRVVTNFTVPGDIRSRVQYSMANNSFQVFSNWSTYTGAPSTSDEKSWSSDMVIIVSIVVVVCLIVGTVISVIYICWRHHLLPFQALPANANATNQVNFQEEVESQGLPSRRIERDTSVLCLLPAVDQHEHDRTEQLQSPHLPTQMNNSEIVAIMDLGKTLPANSKVTNIKFESAVFSQGSDLATLDIESGSESDEDIV